ncbi:protein CLP1 homolog [Nasonia vitripennis]|uniref:Clp1 N-terminal domain-containing protein n=1 Tax=Nasonia vitripennis TaxID=7425 RepID=A0A7M7LUF8_NASVI|nr:protein CLP1 homolog [Nasonia vitripennis]
MSKNPKQFKLLSKSKLRFKLKAESEKVTLELKNGLAEFFGTELNKNKKYEFTSTAETFAVFTWHGCTVKVVVKVDASINRETLMERYLYCHTAEETETRGPVFMIAGSPGVGKTNVSRILINYAAPMGRPSMCVDVEIVPRNRLACQELSEQCCLMGRLTSKTDSTDQFPLRLHGSEFQFTAL